jgi:hypothetical protein
MVEGIDLSMTRSNHSGELFTGLLSRVLTGVAIPCRQWRHSPRTCWSVLKKGSSWKDFWM